MIIHHLGEEPSVLNRFIAQLRDVNIQADRMRFRKNLERIGEVLCYEMSKFLHYKTETTSERRDSNLLYFACWFGIASRLDELL